MQGINYEMTQSAANDVSCLNSVHMQRQLNASQDGRHARHSKQCQCIVVSHAMSFYDVVLQVMSCNTDLLVCLSVISYIFAGCFEIGMITLVRTSQFPKLASCSLARMHKSSCRGVPVSTDRMTVQIQFGPSIAEPQKRHGFHLH